MNKLDELMGLVTVPEFLPAPGPMKPGKAFRPVRTVFASRFSESPLRGIRNPGTGSAAQRAGKRYEKKVLASLEKRFKSESSITLYPSPWIAFSPTVSDERHCQPDLLIESPEEIFLCEIKLSHTADAYWQLAHLYGPVVRHLFPSKPVRLVEITRSFDPNTAFPAFCRLFFSIEHILRTPSSTAVEILQWKL
jgi:hypothetical protein